MIMVSDAGIREVANSFLYVYVSDVDGTYQRALDAEARSVEEPFDTLYGDRRCSSLYSLIHLASVPHLVQTLKHVNVEHRMEIAAIESVD